MLSFRLRALLAATLAVCAGAGLAPSARAAEYSVNVCRHADGSVAPTDGWQTSIADDYAANDVAANSCAQGGQVDLALGAGTPHGRGGGAATGVVTFAATPPPATGWVRMQVWWAYQANPVTASDDPGHLVAGVVGGSPLGCSWGRGTGRCSGSGALAGPPLSSTNLTNVPVAPAAAGQPLAVSVLCDSTPSLCPSATGQPYAQLRAWRVLVTLSDVSAPVFAEQPALPATVAGRVAVPISATDTGSGVHTARLLVDGQTAGAPAVVDGAAGRCAQQADGSFDHLAPCPAQVSSAPELDVSSLPDGKHSIVVRIADAAGNATDSAPAVVTVDNPVALASIPLHNPLRGRGHVHNGSGSASTGKLTAGLRSGASRRLRAKARVLPGGRVRVSGRLVGADRRAVGGAILVLRREPPRRPPQFLTFRTRKNGTFGRVLRWGKTKRLTVHWFAWGDSTTAVSSRRLRFLGAAKIRLRVRPRAPRNGEPLRFSGRVHAAPVGGRVTIQVRTGPYWRTFLTPRVGRRGRYSGRRLLVRSAGMSYCLRARILSQPGFDYSAGFTKPVCRRVRGG